MSRGQWIIIALFGILVIAVCSVTGAFVAFRQKDEQLPAAGLPSNNANQTQAVVTTLTPSTSFDIVSNIPAKRTFHHSLNIKQQYDKVTDKTEVTLLPPAQTRGLELLAGYSYTGQTPAIPDVILLVLVSNSDDWQYLDCHNWNLLLDNSTRLDMHATHDGHVGSGYVLDYVQSQVPIEHFLRIVNAQKVEGRVCNDLFQFRTDQMEALRDFASRMKP